MYRKREILLRKKSDRTRWHMAQEMNASKIRSNLRYVETTSSRGPGVLRESHRAAAGVEFRVAARRDVARRLLHRVYDAAHGREAARAMRWHGGWRWCRLLSWLRRRLCCGGWPSFMSSPVIFRALEPGLFQRISRSRGRGDGSEERGGSDRYIAEKGKRRKLDQNGLQ